MERSELAASRPTSAMPISSFDRVSAGLWTLIIFFGVTALFSALMCVQAEREKVAGREQPQEMRLIPNDFSSPAPIAMGVGYNEPGVEEFPEVEKPQLPDAIGAVTDAPSRQRAQLASVEGTDELMGKGHTLVTRQSIPNPFGRDAERWSIEYESEGIEDYLKQLVAFGIEIGFVNKINDRVELVSDLNTKPNIRVTTKEAERRCYFIHSDSKLRSWDLRVAQNAGVKPEGKIMVQFYPRSATEKLLQLERAEAEARGIEQAKIQRTTFRVRTVGDGYEYYVGDLVLN